MPSNWLKLDPPPAGAFSGALGFAAQPKQRTQQTKHASVAQQKISTAQHGRFDNVARRIIAHRLWRRSRPRGTPGTAASLRIEQPTCVTQGILAPSPLRAKAWRESTGGPYQCVGDEDGAPESGGAEGRGRRRRRMTRRRRRGGGRKPWGREPERQRLLASLSEWRKEGAG